MTKMARYLRVMMRASLSDNSLLSFDEAVEAVPHGGTAEARTWLRQSVRPVTTELGELYRWGDVLSALESQKVSVVQEQEFLTRTEVARLLRVPERQVRDLHARGLPFHRLGHRTVRYRRDAVLDWARQTADRSPEGCSDGSQEKKRRVVRRLPVSGPRERAVEAIQAFDWSDHYKTGGT
jgi:excisionase family DNA binding protein